MSFSPNDKKAMKWFFESNPQFRPRLMVYPYLAWSSGGKHEEKHVKTVRRDWENRNKKEGAKK